MNTSLIDTDSFSEKMRSRIVDDEGRRLLVATLKGSDQEADLSEPVNCDGLGRIRHFRRSSDAGWPQNPLPLDPALNCLGLATQDVVRAQVFQNAACNWRCWYCYVPFALLGGDESRGRWVTAENLVDLYLQQPEPPLIVDLSGGQPDLTPEWIPWMMEALENKGLAGSTYLWSDDNLSNDYFWTKLTTRDIDKIIGYKNYGKVGCFKGFDPESFSFNTKASPELFKRQFNLFQKAVGIGLDLYGYATFTGPNPNGLDRKVAEFLDHLQEIHPLLPLRVIPLRVSMFNPVENRRLSSVRLEDAMAVQEAAIEVWTTQLNERFDTIQLSAPIYANRLI